MVRPDSTYVPTEERWRLLHMAATGGPVPDDATDEELELIDELKASMEANPGLAYDIPFD